MGTFLPQSPVQYLSRAGDVVDQIAWQYYGFYTASAEAVYRANRWLSRFPAVLPAGLLIILPVLQSSLILKNQTIELWNYAPTVQPVASLPNAQAVDTLAADYAAALAAYRVQRDSFNDPTAQLTAQLVAAASGGSTDIGGSGVVDSTVAAGGVPSVGGAGAGGVPEWEAPLAPPEIADAEWFAVLFQDGSGNWGIGRMSRANLAVETANAIAAAGGIAGIGGGGGSPGLPAGWLPTSATLLVAGPGGAPSLQTIEILAHA